VSVVAVIQARLSSERLPGKVLLDVGGKPLLQYVIERLRHSRRAAGTVVATSEEPSDDAIAAFCEDAGVACFRGPLGDVAARFLRLFDACPADAYVRISGDSPLLDPFIVDRVIDAFDEYEPDLATNVHPRTFPTGQSVEVFAPGVYRAAYHRFAAPEDFEHVTHFFYQHAGDFDIRNVRHREDTHERRFSIDNPDDVTWFRRMIELMDRDHWEYHLEDLLRLQNEAIEETHHA